MSRWYSGITSTPAEINLLDGAWASFSNVIPAPGADSGEIQIQFLDAAGASMAVPVTGTFYSSSLSTGLNHADVPQGITTTKGVVSLLHTTAVWTFTTNATGELDMSLAETGGTGNIFYVVFKKVNGLLAISSAITIGP